MKRVFVCSPFRGDVEANVRIALDACRRVALAGDSPYAPHTYLPAVLDDSNPRERALGLACGEAWLAAADEVLVVGEPSAGMQREIDRALRLGIPVVRRRA